MIILTGTELTKYKIHVALAGELTVTCFEHFMKMSTNYRNYTAASWTGAISKSTKVVVVPVRTRFTLQYTAIHPLPLFSINTVAKSGVHGWHSFAKICKKTRSNIQTLIYRCWFRIQGSLLLQRYPLTLSKVAGDFNDTLLGHWQETTSNSSITKLISKWLIIPHQHAINMTPLRHLLVQRWWHLCPIRSGGPFC